MRTLVSRDLGFALVTAIASAIALSFVTSTAFATRITVNDPYVCSCCYICHAPEPYCCCIECKPRLSAGFAGGGAVATPTGSAHVSAFGTKQHKQGSLDTVLGAFTWFDPGWEESGLYLGTLRIKSYRRLRQGKTRELRGIVSANGTGQYRFVLTIDDNGPPGSGADVVTLRVRGLAASGAGAGGTEYFASGNLAEGDFTINTIAAQVVP